MVRKDEKATDTTLSGQVSHGVIWGKGRGEEVTEFKLKMANSIVPPFHCPTSSTGRSL